MAIKKKATKKVENRGAARSTSARKATAPKDPSTFAPESKEVLAKGHEWYDDGGNEGLKQRPVGG